MALIVTLSIVATVILGIVSLAVWCIWEFFQIIYGDGGRH